MSLALLPAFGTLILILDRLSLQPDRPCLVDIMGEACPPLNRTRRRLGGECGRRRREEGLGKEEGGVTVVKL